MKVIEVIKNFFIMVLGLIFFTFAIALTMVLLNTNNYGVPQFDETSLVIIRSDLTSDKYKKGDLVVIKYHNVKDLEIGDEVFVYKLGENNSISIDLGQINKTNEMGAKSSIEFENGGTYTMEYVIGKADNTYSDIGAYLSFFTSRWGFLFTVLVPSFLIFVYQVYALIIEIKYGEEEFEG
ncbi:MAG: hypothetical protein PHW32_03115 [Bacilli bacterium]|nr:hypothetical protein [Bacilli bacterium]MDD4282587.1 hypothetical protein [Bacilli bacterium]MDD4718700.1 hypothetical protein [Bacilli bacterium]